jgi:hypothetical protein
MNTFGWILNISLVLVVLLQLRERRFDRRMVVTPLAIVAVAAAEYLHTIPSAGNDLALIAVLALAGAVLGAACGALTSVRADERGAVVRAGAVAAAIWVIGVGARMAFVYASEHGGHAAIVRFSVEHHITGGPAWTAALVLMGFATVLARLAVLSVRARRARGLAAPAPVPTVGGLIV